MRLRVCRQRAAPPEVHCKTSFFPPPLPPEIQGTEEGTQRGGWTIPADRAGMTVAFSPSGNRLAVVAATDLVRILDAGDGKELLSHDQDDARHASAVFSNDGKLIASPQGRRTVELWDAANGRTIRRFEIPEQPGKGFGPDGAHCERRAGRGSSSGRFFSGWQPAHRRGGQSGCVIRCDDRQASPFSSPRRRRGRRVARQLPRRPRTQRFRPGNGIFLQNHRPMGSEDGQKARELTPRVGYGFRSFDFPRRPHARLLHGLLGRQRRIQ